MISKYMAKEETEEEETKLDSRRILLTYFRQMDLGN